MVKAERKAPWMEKLHKIPGPDHPITIDPIGSRITVFAAERIIADSTEALSLREAAYPAVFYIPRKDVDEEVLVASGTTSYCPYKGDCSYYSVGVAGTTVKDAAWSYEEPFEDVSLIAGYLSFYPDRVEISFEDYEQEAG